MVKIRTNQRLDALLSAALDVFLEAGYRGATLQEVANRAKVSVGSVYSYAASKEALFELVLRSALLDSPPALAELPYQVDREKNLITWVWERFEGIVRFPLLEEALETEDPANVEEEFDAILREIWAWQSTYWRAIELIERCARDWPDLQMLYYKQFRRGVFGRATELIERRMNQGLIRRYPDPATALRVIVENIAFFAMHRHVRPDSAGLDEDTCRETVIQLLVRGFMPDHTNSKGHA